MKYIYAFLSCFLFFFATSVQAQSRIQGQVISEEGLPIENASVELLNSHLSKMTNSEGIFVFPEIPSGLYSIRISKRGFADHIKKIQANDSEEIIEIQLSSEAERLEEVLVTAQKREEIIQEIPLSISSLDYEAVKESYIHSVNDLTAIAPNLYAADPGDGRTVAAIRGIVSTSYDPTVATYIDGVNQFSLDTYIPQLFDIERLEVLRGPQGTLYGRNAMGGVINIITKEPGNETSVFGEVTLANYGQKRVLAGLRTPLVEDKLFFGIAGLYEESDGFYQNEFNDSNYDEEQEFSGNVYLKYLFSPSWKATLNFKMFAAENEGPFPLVQGVEAAFEDPYTLNQNQISAMNDNTYNVSLVLNHTGNNINFLSQSSYQKNYRYYQNAIDADFSPLDAISIYNNFGKDWNNVRVATQEFRFSSAAGNEDRLKWTAGTFLFYQESPVKQAARFGEDAGLLGSEDTNFSLITSSDGTAKGIALFGQGTYTLLENLDLIGGLRYDYEHKEQSILGEYQRFEDPAPVFEFQKDTTASASFEAWSPKVGLSYHLQDENLIFLTYSRGFRAGGLTPISTDPSQPPLFSYAPEFSNNLELGAKNVFFEDKLILNTTVFYTRVKDVQVPTLVLPEGFTVTRNTGELTSKGIEVQLKALLLKDLELNYDFGLTDAKYEQLRISQDGSEVNLEENEQIFTPDFTSLLALQYERDLSEKWQLFARGEWKYLGEQYFDLANNIRQAPYHLFNSHVGFSYEGLKMTFWARNIFDQQYISYAYNFGAVRLGSPGTYGVTASFEIW